MRGRGAIPSRSRHLVAFLLGAVLGGGGGLAWGQAVTLTPSLTILEEYDDNIDLSSTNRRSDFVTSVSPGLRLTVRESPWDVTLSASARAAYYADHSELNTTTDHQSASLEIAFRPSPRLTASVTDTFARSLNTAETDLETGITTGRFRSYSNIVTPAVRYQVDPLTLLAVHYSFGTLRTDSPFTRDEDTHEAHLFVEHQFTSRDAGTLRYTFRHFQVEGLPDRDAHLPKGGFSHAFSPTIRVSMDAGPLFLQNPDGSWVVTGGGMVEYAQTFSEGRFSLIYERDARLAGFTSVVGVSQTVRATVSYTLTRLLALGLESSAGVTDAVGDDEEVRQALLRATLTYTPARDVTLGLDSVVRVTDGINTVEDFFIYEVGVRLDYRLVQWLTASVGYRRTHQEDRTGPFDLERNLVFISLTASTDIRLY